VAIAVFGCWVYPIYGILPSASQGYILLVVVQFYIFGSSFAHLLSAALPDAQTAGNVATFLFTLIVAFNGVFVPPNALPGFWIFLYRISPLTYIVGALSGAALHGRPVVCTLNELVIFQPPVGQTCGKYLEDYLATAPGQLLDQATTQDCSYCSLSNADEFLAGYNVSHNDRWRNFGIVWGFIAFNIFMTFALYYLFRVKTWKRKAA
jgi:ATP-binding cassette, subfamily G (WHITE), member 2, PDR